MNVNRPNEPGSMASDDEPVEVLVEDLFIEEYPPGIVQLESENRGLETRRRTRGRIAKILLGVLAIGAIAMLMMRGRIGRGGMLQKLGII